MLPTQTTFISDKATSQDALGRKGFANSLADALARSNRGDCFVLGIEGEWGSGKSSIIEMIKDRLSNNVLQKRKPVVIDFNPWMASTTGSLVESMITQIAASVCVTFGADVKAIDASEKLLNYVGLLKHLKHLTYLKYVPGAGWVGNIADDLSSFATASSDAAKAGRAAIADLKSALPTLSIERRRDDVRKSLSDFDHPVIVIVDDLDRLPADDIRLMIQAIKAVADFPNVTYLLAYDHRIVATALGESNFAKGAAYLEKIVQVSYPIPPLFRFQLLDLTRKKIMHHLDVIGVKLKADERRIFDDAISIVSRLCRQPRDLIRLINRLTISVPALNGLINTVDVIVFEALTQQFPEIRQSIHQHPTIFTGKPFPHEVNLFSEDEQFQRGFKAAKNPGPISFDPFLPQSTNERETASKAIEFIFRSTRFGSADNEKRRLSKPDNLANLFCMTSLDRVLPNSFVHELLNDHGALRSFLSESAEEELVLSLRWIAAQLPSLEKIDVEGTVSALLDVSVSAQDVGLITEDLCDVLASIQLDLLKKLPAAAQKRVLSDIVERNPLSIAEIVASTVLSEVGTLTETRPAANTNYPEIAADREFLATMNESITDRIQHSHRERTLQNEVRFQEILAVIPALTGSTETSKKMIVDVCTTRQGLEKFLQAFESAPFGFRPRKNLLLTDSAFLLRRMADEGLNDLYSHLIETLRDERFIRDASLEESTPSKPFLKR